MMARGEVYGLLNIQTCAVDAEAQLALAAPVASALADAMSLALANIALREKLRTQALRDPLTGLYNRRYMEDVLERYANLADRNETPLSIVMIDLDHFKRLNDDLGHAVGDAVLCEVAAAIVGSIRPCDVACRYGGEELVLLLPDCGLAEATAKAEMISGPDRTIVGEPWHANQCVIRHRDDPSDLVETGKCPRRRRRGHVSRQSRRAEPACQREHQHAGEGRHG